LNKILTKDKEEIEEAKPSKQLAELSDED